MVNVIGNMVMLPARPWVKSAGNAMQRITSRRCAGQRTSLSIAHTSKKTVDDSGSSDTEFFVGNIHQKDISAVNTSRYKTIEVEGVKVNFQLDTDAKCSIISQKVFQTPKGKKMTKSKARLTLYSRYHIKTTGTTKILHVYARTQNPASSFS